MRSLRLRVMLWFALCLLGFVLAFTAFTYFHLQQELRDQTWLKDNSELMAQAPVRHYSEAEIRLFTNHIIKFSFLPSLALTLMVVTFAHLLARKSLLPITEINTQLRQLSIKDLDRGIQLREIDPELQDLIGHINDLLRRLDQSFRQLSEYSGQVAHEIKTPLTILRLKLEQAAARMDPVLSEEIQDEIFRLTRFVEQALLVAKAEQGRLQLHLETFDFCELLTDVVSDISLLADREGRTVNLHSPEKARVEADRKYLRQILQNLFTNSLRHGVGAITVRLKQTDSHVRCILFNRVPPPGTIPKAASLGMGLRVVNAIALAHPDLEIHHRSDPTRFLISVRIPLHPA